MKTPQSAPPPTHQATLSQALPHPRQETSRRLCLAPSQGNFLFPRCPVPAQSCDPGLHPLKTSQAVSQQLRRGRDGGHDCKTGQEAEPGPAGTGKDRRKESGQAQPLTG